MSTVYDCSAKESNINCLEMDNVDKSSENISTSDFDTKTCEMNNKKLDYLRIV